jgi:hypothetical protein
MIGLLINHAVFEYQYSKMNTGAEQLSEKEIRQIQSVYEYLSENGTEIFPGFDGTTIDLIIFNDKYEFLICEDADSNEWIYTGHNDILNKNIYRRPAKDPQAFAVYTQGRWVGSMATQISFNRSIFNTMTDQAGILGYLIPPQIFHADTEYYKGTVIHEMLHAFQAQENQARVDSAASVHDVSSDFYEDEQFDSLIKSEGEYLQKALDAKSREDTLRYVALFLETRKIRRAQCGMTPDEIAGEREFEWLEGMARYAEYQSSKGSKSIIRSNLDKVIDKVKVKSDDRYYSLGLAEGLILDKLGVNWKDNAFSSEFVFEDALDRSSS